MAERNFGRHPSTSPKMQIWIINNIDNSHSVKNKPSTFHKGICHYDCMLPSQNQIPPEVSAEYLKIILDQDLWTELQQGGVLNWEKQARRLYPINVPRDGNCLLHSAAFAMWGVYDSHQILRQLVNQSMSQDPKQSYKARFQQQRMTEMHGIAPLSIEVIDNEWKDALHCVNCSPTQVLSRAIPHKFLESIHIYVLANILRRPIIVLSCTNLRSLQALSLQENSISGIYLPLEWAPSECSKTPLVFGFSFQTSHFCPLLSEFLTDSSSSTSSPLLPLSTSDSTPLPVRCLKDTEGPLAGQLMQDYLTIKSLTRSSKTYPNTEENIAFCVLSLKPLPMYLNKVESDFLEFCHSKSNRSRQGIAETAPFMNNENAELPQEMEHFAAVSVVQGKKESTKKRLCVTPGCSKRGHKEFLGLCTHCLRNYTKIESGTELLSTGEGDRKLYIPVTLKVNEHSGGQGTDLEETQTIKTHLATTSEPQLNPTAPLLSASFESSGQLLSMMNERCRNSGCGYRCSKQTYPYCHECNNRRLATMQTSESNEDLLEFTPKLTVNEVVPTVCSEDYEKLKQTQDVLSSPKCTNTFSDRRHTVKHSSQPMLPEQESRNTLRAEILGINNEEDELVISMEPSVPSGLGERYMCVAPACDKQARESYHLCDSCEEIILQARTRQAQQAPSPVKAKPTRAKPTLLAMSRGESCITPGCRSFGDPNNANMCSSCYRQSPHYKTHGFQETNHFHVKPVLPLKQDPVHQQAEQLSHHPHTSQRLHHLAGKESSVSKKSVDKQNTSTMHSSTAYNTIPEVSSEFEPTSLPLGTAQFASSISRVSSSPRADPHRSQVNPSGRDLDLTPQPSSKEEFQLLMQNLEVEQQLNKTKCRIEGCTNFGNPHKTGYCNACYHARRLQEEELLRSQWGLDVVDGFVKSDSRENLSLCIM